ncbi:MAG: hypothetical protein ACKVZJ_07675 [Phycisphaerales bacterium]
MVRHGIRGAVIALACGSAVATAMGVLSRGNDVGTSHTRKDDISQRVRYQIESDGTALIPVVRGLPSSHLGQGIVSIGVPEFMTRDTAKSFGAGEGALAAAQTIHHFAGAPMRAGVALPIDAYSAAVRGGETGGFAYAYSNKVDASQNDLAVDLAQAQGVPASKTYGSDAPFSGNAAPRGGSDLADVFQPFAGPDVVSELPQNTPGETNSTANPAVATGPVGGPTTNSIPNGVALDGQSIWADPAPNSAAASTAVPAPGAAGVLALAGLVGLRRRR